MLWIIASEWHTYQRISIECSRLGIALCGVSVFLTQQGVRDLTASVRRSITVSVSNSV